MVSLVGRPRVEGTYITLQLNDHCLNVVDTGAKLLQVRNCIKKPNRSAWIRDLMDFTFGDPALIEHSLAGAIIPSIKETMSADLLRSEWPVQWFLQVTPHKVTLKLEDHQRIFLRQFECYSQSLDWNRYLLRNEAALLLIAAHGPLFNRFLAAPVTCN